MTGSCYESWTATWLQQGWSCQRRPVVLRVIRVRKWQDRRLDEVPRVAHDGRFLCHRHGTVRYLVQNLVETGLKAHANERL